jgi:anti-anti-sigma factor
LFRYEISCQETDKAIVSLLGDMDIDATEIIEEEMTPLLMDYADIELDFSNVPFVDSSGIGLLITLINQLKGHNIRVRIIHLQEDVMHVFSLLQLPEILGEDVCADFKPEG